jgi:coproporphyrinogen III oxidase-like Fe-S oxidoreductase
MDENQKTLFLTTIITALADIDEAPAGIVYSGLMGKGLSFNGYMALQASLVGTGLCTLSGNVLRITDDGRAMAAEINKLIAEEE